jgi:hypothetical protein
MSRLGKPYLIAGTYVLRPTSPGELQAHEQVMAHERRNLYRKACPCLPDQNLSSGGGIYYGAGWPGPDKQDVPAPQLSKTAPTCGLPGENLPERLFRKLMVGLVTRNRATQIEAWTGFITIARRVNPVHGPDAAADILAEALAGKRPHSSIRYFNNAIKSRLIDGLRAKNATKRGEQFMHVGLDEFLLNKKASDTPLPAKSTRHLSLGQLNDLDREGVARKYHGPRVMNGPESLHDPAGYEEESHKRLPKKKSRWGGVKG